MVEAVLTITGFLLDGLVGGPAIAGAQEEPSGGQDGNGDKQSHEGVGEISVGRGSGMAGVGQEESGKDAQCGFEDVFHSIGSNLM